MTRKKTTACPAATELLPLHLKSTGRLVSRLISFEGVPITVRVKRALCTYAIRLRDSYNQNDETLSRNSLVYMSNASFTHSGELVAAGHLDPVGSRVNLEHE